MKQRTDLNATMSYHFCPIGLKAIFVLDNEIYYKSVSEALMLDLAKFLQITIIRPR